MSCTLTCPESDVKFPIEITSCPMRDGYSVEDKSQRVFGFGGRSFDKDNFIEVQAEYWVESDESATVLADWYFKQIDKGANKFKLEIPIFGQKQEWTAKMTNKLKESDFMGTHRKVKFVFNIYDYSVDLCAALNRICKGV